MSDYSAIVRKRMGDEPVVGHLKNVATEAGW